jgi:hypothetical protein
MTCPTRGKIVASSGESVAETGKDCERDGCEERRVFHDGVRSVEAKNVGSRL